MITLKQMHHALSVERNLHFRKAAEECNISQSALSASLLEMEKQLGFQLFERDNRKVLITRLGREVLDRIRLIETQVDDLKRLIGSNATPLSGNLCIGVIPTIGPYLLPKVLPALQEEYPDLRLEIIEDQSAELLEMLRRGSTDAAIIALPYLTEGFLNFQFWQENLHWLIHKDLVSNSLRKAERATIAKFQLMLLKDGHCLKDHALFACKLKSHSSHSFSATSLPTLVQLVKSKMGSTLVPDIALSQLVNEKSDLKAVPLSEPGPHRELVITIRPNYPGLPSIEALVKLFKKELKKIYKA